MEKLNDLWNSGRLWEFYDEALDSSAMTSLVTSFSEWRKEMARMEKVPLEEHGDPSEVAFVYLSIEPKTLPILDRSFSINAYGKSSFFNESHWFNEGIVLALKSGAKWVIVMSDDLYEITPLRKLKKSLELMEEEGLATVWVDSWPDNYHSYWAYLAKKHPLERWAGKGHKRLDGLCKKLGIETVIAPMNPIRRPLYYWAFNKAFPRPRISGDFRMTSDFVILSAEWCKKVGPEVLNENFLGWEDMDLSMRLKKEPSTSLDFRIGSEIGGTIKPGMNKALREAFNLSMFNKFLGEGRYA